MTVIAHHLVWTVYGTWLANDPRGSGSRRVHTPELAALGDAHYGRKQIQPRRREVRAFYHEAASRLQYPVVRFEPRQFEIVAQSFAETIERHRYTCYACAIMPNHVHLVVRKHRELGEAMIAHFQRESCLRLCAVLETSLYHPVWTKGGWDRYLDSPHAVRSRIQYVEGNPIKEGLTRQVWPFVVEYDGWPFHRKANRKR